MAKIRREFKNVVYNYTDAEVKVREATSNDPWGPSTTLMSELAEYTYHVQAYSLVMGMLWRRLNDHGKNWRHVYKSLVVLEYLVKNGSQRVVQQCKDNMFSIETLKDFQYLDKEGKDQGTIIREKAKNLAVLLKDDQKLDEERSKASKTKTRTGIGNTTVVKDSTPTNSAGATTSGRTAGATTGRFEPDIKQSRPSAKDEEDLQLQLALKMSKEEAEKQEKLKKQEEESLRIALELSKSEVSGDSSTLEANDNTSGGGDDDLLGLGDPWVNPPSYDAITSPNTSDDPWVPPTTSAAVPPLNDPFTKDPFAVSPSVSPVGGVTADPWKPVPVSPPPDTSFGVDGFGSSANDPWSSFGTSGTISTNTATTLSGGPTTLPPPLDMGLGPISTTSPSDPYNMSSLNQPLGDIASEQKGNNVEQSFLGENAGLVNLDALITPLPPPSSINPFGTSSIGANPSPNKSSNPFEVGKQPAPSLKQLGGGPTGFDPLPPPLIPAGQMNNTNFNPFS